MMTLTFLAMWLSWARKSLEHPIEIDLDRNDLEHWLFHRDQR